MSDSGRPWETVIWPEPRSGQEQIKGTESTVLDYWRWAYSDLLSNTSRGIYAEFLVAKAVGDESKARDGWAVHDVTMPPRDGHGGISIEVKSGGYLQSWKQGSFSSVQFGRLRSRGWNPKTNERDTAADYHADVYVFALQTCKDPDRLDLLDVGQWDFRVLPRSDLCALGTKSISWTRVRELAPARLAWNELADAIRESASAAPG